MRRRDSREIFKEMSKAELEIIAVKNKESKRRRKGYGGAGRSGERSAMGSEGSGDEGEEKVPVRAGNDIINVLYRTVIPHLHPNLEAHKTHFEVMQEVYDHTENKTDVTRNMLATHYLKDPNNFDAEAKDVKNILKNEITWPQGYIPEENKVMKFKMTKTKEELFLDWLREKHSVKMAPLNKLCIDDAIQDLSKICQTSDAITTYRAARWKAFFSKYKNQSIAERRELEQKVRDRIERELPRKLRETVNRERFGGGATRQPFNSADRKSGSNPLDKVKSKQYQMTEKKHKNFKNIGHPQPPMLDNTYLPSNMDAFCIPEN